ncbi:selenocysteine-specific translation elongation factor [Corynebacterium imitans]|uniref:selenocysteine-specific translation elongation factor n=1 Tax=Corynebacterium imitans TaxID=156978 RepID=UPI00254EFD83|nr:selenocysteine-specific translation elongation factor [Corynebacterium imitans]MDK8307427.1 selenocysteine-specific translation elongation factor [Corynebacterium imitans]MDK8637034.1 selenocysteine-specific translation elongation factor [Corynebacterium imitans]MDK8771888.1 selenocysteine-specific translation elongation factor [Corynebacterium imitans]
MPYVIATAGHVDHGKSTLVKALTGMEPDRWEEEQQRGLTIDLGFVWAKLDTLDVAFVDVPGHERFIANMLAGVGPAPAVLFVVAADEGWMAQSRDHAAAINAFGISNVVIAMTRADRADAQRRDEVRAEIAREVAGTTLAGAPIVEVSAHTGEGVDALVSACVDMLRAAPLPDPAARVRFWVDRAFSVKGAGTVVTGTLTAGTIRLGDTLRLGSRDVKVRGIQSEDAPVDAARPAMRAALNLRDISAEEVRRGDALCTPEAWEHTSLLDAHVTTGTPATALPHEVHAHLGTAQVTAKIRPFGEHYLRLILERPLPVTLGDALVLRAPGAQHILAGVRAVDVDPPELPRRGDGRRRAAELPTLPNLDHEIARRVAVTPAHLARLGFSVAEKPPQGTIEFAGYWIRAAQVMEWKRELIDAVAQHTRRDPLSAGLTAGAAVDKLGLPDPKLLALVAAAAKLTLADGLLTTSAAIAPGIASLEAHLRRAPFQAPEAADLERWELGAKELAAAERAGRIIRLGANRDIVLLADASTHATERLRPLDTPFTASQARKAWDTTRRVAIPLLEYLDAAGVTRRVDGTARVLR